MSDNVATVGVAPQPSRNWRAKLAVMYRRSDSLRGYSLLSPTLLVMAFTMCLPFAMMVVMSFWSQQGFEFNTEFSMANYKEAFTSPIYEALLVRSLKISGACAIATVVISYPMAYYVAFHVHRRKMLWIILMTLPFWTSYLLRVFAWKIVLGWNGAINSGLKTIGLIEEPLEFLLYSPDAVVITSFGRQEEIFQQLRTIAGDEIKIIKLSDI